MTTPTVTTPVTATSETPTYESLLAAVAARLEAGTVWINSHGGVHPMIPFGGVKKSGYGLEFGVEGLKSVAVPQVING